MAAEQSRPTTKENNCGFGKKRYSKWVLEINSMILHDELSRMGTVKGKSLGQLGGKAETGKTEGSVRHTVNLKGLGINQEVS